MFAIYKREMRSYFTSPIGYVFMAMFLAVNAFFFCFCTLLMGVDSDVSSYFTFIMWALIILIPILTMKMLSEERKARTEQLILTSPVGLMSMVAGKFFAAFTMFAGTYLVGSLINFSLLYKYSAANTAEYAPDTMGPNLATLISSSVGILLIGAAFIAIGLFISALTENQIVAAVGTIGILFFMMIVGVLSSFIDVYFIRAALNWISVFSRYGNFSFGILDLASLLYYFSICFIFMFLTVRVYEKRRWS